jgi:CCR4-NOT transcription complex subunit 10
MVLLHFGRMLGHLYAAEALVLLDKISDAIEHLNPEHIKELTLMFPSPEKDVDREKLDNGTEQHKPLKGESEYNRLCQPSWHCAFTCTAVHGSFQECHGVSTYIMYAFVACAAWFPNTLPTARAVIQYNLAVAFAIRGELDKAGETLKQVCYSE